MRKTLLFRIAVPYVLLIIILLSALGIYLTSFVKNSYIESLIQHLESDAKIVANQVIDNLSTSGDKQLLNNIVKNESIIYY